MAAVPALQGHVPLASPRDAAAAEPSAAARSGAAEVDRLRRLAAGITTWRCARLTAHSLGPVLPAPPAVPLGEFSRAFARWLAAHPQRANEPVEWLVPDALDAQFR